MELPPDPPGGVQPNMPNNPNRQNLRVKAAEWMSNNPEAMALFRMYARKLVTVRRRFGMKLLIERVRWDSHVRTNSDDGFKISNNHGAYIVRQLINEMPAMEALVTCRETRY